MAGSPAQGASGEAWPEGTLIDWFARVLMNRSVRGAPGLGQVRLTGRSCETAPAWSGQVSGDNQSDESATRHDEQTRTTTIDSVYASPWVDWETVHSGTSFAC